MSTANSQGKCQYIAWRVVTLFPNRTFGILVQVFYRLNVLTVSSQKHEAEPQAHPFIYQFLCRSLIYLYLAVWGMLH